MSFRTTSQEDHATTNVKHFDHYVDLFMRKKWYIILISVVTFAGWLFFINYSGIVKPQLEATSILQFDDPNDISAVSERVNLQADTRSVLVKSRTFLNQVAGKLSLQLQMKRYPRSDVFDSIRVGIDAVQGEYRLTFHDSLFTVTYQNPMSKENAKTLSTGYINELKHLKMEGLNIQWNKHFLNKPFNITFSITSLRDAVDYILDNLSIETSGFDGNIMSVSMRGKDPVLMTDVVNTIADDFVFSHSKTKQERRDTILTILEKQLFAAKKDMINAEAALRNFREQHPTLGLQDAFSPPVEITALKETEAELKATLLQAQSLQKRFQSADDTTLIGLLTEMVSFLNRYQTATAQGLQSELITLNAEADILEQTYSPYHPEVRRNRHNIKVLGGKISSALSDLMNDISRKIDENDSKIDKINREINNLPSRELQFFNLQRRYEVNTEIYAAVLTRFNEARLAESVKTGDVHVVDHAVPPTKGIDVKILFIFLVLGIVVSFGTGLGPFLLLDLIDKTAHSSRDIHRMTSLTVLESIPVKGTWKDHIIVDSESGVKPGISDFINETYRSLRTKILLSLEAEIPKRLLVTSLAMDEGKSFTTVHLGMAVAQMEKTTLLIDADLHKGSLNSYFGFKRTSGLSDLLTAKDELVPSMLQSVIQPTPIRHLTLLSSGTILENVSGLLNSERFRKILEILSADYEMIIIDTPPFAVVTDAITLQDIVSRYLIVVRARHTNIFELNRKIGEFPGLHKKILGVILNGASYKRMEYYHYTNYQHKQEKNREQ